jgi:hypothetical protein
MGMQVALLAAGTQVHTTTKATLQASEVEQQKNAGAVQA